MTVIERVDALQRRHPGMGFPIAVIYKYVDDQGGYLAALITYYGFVSIFPLLLLSSTILGIVLAGDPGAQQHVLHSALNEFPVIGANLSTPKALSGGAVGIGVGILGALYGGLGIAQAVQNAMNTAWRVPRNERPNPFKARGRSLLLLATAGLAVLATTGLSAVGNGSGGLGGATRILTIALSLVINAATFVLVFRIATARDLSVHDVLPGALAAAIILQLLQSFGAAYFSHVVAKASDTNGVFATVLGLIAFFYLASVALVFCVEVNAVRVERLHPRALLTPFTDSVELTSGDRRAYTTQATAQRSKGFETVEVTFQPPDH